MLKYNIIEIEDKEDTFKTPTASGIAELIECNDIFIDDSEPFILKEELDEEEYKTKYREKILKQQKETEKKHELWRQEIECELMLCYMDKTYNTGDTIPYMKDLKKRIPKFKKEVYNKLTAEDKKMIEFLDKYSLKLINQSIKINIEEHKDILKNK